MDRKARRAVKAAQAEYDIWKGRAVTNKPFDPRPLIKMREGGDREDVYKDSKGSLTAGIGHLLTAEELKLYKEGDLIPQEQRNAWFKQDSQRAIQAAQAQAEELGHTAPRFVENLTSVNFQLGTAWNLEHKNTWRLMKEGNYAGAATEAANSKWFRQTPDRVKDFQTALRNVDKPTWN